MRISRLMILGLVAYVGARIMRDRQHLALPAPPRGRRQRETGTNSTPSRPSDWDMVDERDDESFPASDPPGTY